MDERPWRLSPVWLGVLAMGLTLPALGCSDKGTEAVETPEMRDHLQEVTQGYAKDYAKQYGKGR